MTAFRVMLVLWGLAAAAAHAQSPPPRLLPFEGFLHTVAERHPLGRTADLRTEEGRARLTARRGAFDPALAASYAEKDFSGKDYYALTNTYLSWQSPLALRLKAGFEHTSGIYVNPEDRTPGGGLFFAGVSLPLLQGLFIDEARGNMALARIGVQSLENDRRVLLNDLAFAAAVDYWAWYEDAMDVTIDQEGVALARERFQFIRNVYRTGDRASIDTLEAFIQVQQRDLSLAERLVSLQKTGAVVEAWLRASGDSTASVDQLYPSAGVAERMQLDSSWPDISKVDTHPELRVYAFKETALRIERRMKWEKIKPKLNVDYTMMNGDPVLMPAEEQQAGRKIGVEFKMPLFLREERGELSLNRIKLRENDFLTEAKRQDLRAKFEGYRAEVERLRVQVVQFTTAVENYRLLLEAERTRFINGESSVFLVNARESAYLEARRKLNQLVAKYFKAEAGLRWTTGQFPGA